MKPQTVTLKLNPDFKLKPLRVGLGTKIKQAIHKVLDATPMPATFRQKVKDCRGCTQREVGINAAQQRFLDRLAARRAAKPPIK